MARLLVYAATTPLHSDNRKQPARYIRGDVVSVVEDNDFLGMDPENSGIFRIIEMPHVRATDPRVIALVSRDPGNVDDAYRTDLGWATHKRQAHVDLDMIEAIAQTKLGRSLATGEKIVIQTAAKFEKSIVYKLPVPRSTVIG